MRGRLRGGRAAPCWGRRCGARGRGDSETAVANSSAALVAFVAAVSRGWGGAGRF